MLVLTREVETQREDPYFYRDIKNPHSLTAIS